MNVRELINKLLDCDMNGEVVVETAGGQYITDDLYEVIKDEKPRTWLTLK